MSAYEKPLIHVVPEQAEGIFMASGDKTVCRFGRTEANPGADTCQASVSYTHLDVYKRQLLN